MLLVFGAQDVITFVVVHFTTLMTGAKCPLTDVTLNLFMQKKALS